MASAVDDERMWAELGRMALPQDALHLVRGPDVSDHAVLRFRERIARIPPDRARHQLETMAAAAEWDYLPHRWMPVLLYDDTHFGFVAERPDVYLLERNGVIVTVLTERLLHRRARRTGGRSVQPTHRRAG